MDSCTNHPAPSPLVPMFEAFRNDLDEHHDRRERIFKTSRDITALSKKILRTFQQSSLPPSIQNDVDTHSQKIHDLFHSVSSDLQASNAWRWQRQISSGIQEYMEAISFQHYLKTQTLMTYTEARGWIPFGIMLTEDDYILGLLDLVGELMRFAITTMATTGSLPRRSDDGGRDILTDMRFFRSLLESSHILTEAGAESLLGKAVEKKMKVMRTCIEKVENAAYGMTIRGRERPKGWMPELENGTGEKRSVNSSDGDAES
ncbi:MAG: hypothetical protein Q9163_001478 [Psora crenata]